MSEKKKKKMLEARKDGWKPAPLDFQSKTHISCAIGPSIHRKQLTAYPA